MKSVLSAACLIAALGSLCSGTAAAASATCEQMASNPKLDALVKPQPASLEGARSFTYKSIGGTALRLHVFEPPAGQAQPSKRPAIVLFFGGAWMIGTVAEMAPPAAYLASRGMVAIVPEYRVYCRDGANVVDEIADAKSALRWVRAHAGELGVDASRIAASGGSAGGHLALSTAMFDALDPARADAKTSARPDLLVLFYPCVDETTEEEKSYGGYALGTHAEEVSPLFHIAAGLPRTLIIQGTADSLDPSVKKYCASATASGSDCTLIEYDGAPHGFMTPGLDSGKWYQKALLDMDRFLVAAGYLAGAAPTEAASKN